MPKVVSYKKGSIIFFDGDSRDDRIFILQSGSVVLTEKMLETNASTNESLSVGEFFGVKSALAHKPRTETAVAAADSMVVQLTVPEFEKVVSPNQEVILKMLRVFSRDLRVIHRKTEDILKNGVMRVSMEDGMLQVAQGFFDEELFHSCCDVCGKLIARQPKAPNMAKVQALLKQAKLEDARRRKVSGGQAAAPARTVVIDRANFAALKQFSLPMFERFSREYNDGDVIISEYEPGDCFYLIQEGEVQLEKCIKGTIKSLDILHPGEFFGEMAILDNSPRSATCLARGHVKCLEFNKANFRILVTGNPQIAMVLLKLFCKRIYDQRRRFSILMITDMQARVADVFMMYNEMQAVELKGGDYKRKFALTVSDVAHWAGISVEEAREELGKFVSHGKIEIFEKHIIVRNIMDMKRLVDTYTSIRNHSND